MALFDWVKKSRSKYQPLAQAFEPGFTATVDGEKLVFETFEVGLLCIPSGRVLACDPYYVDDRPINVVFPPGNYPVTLSVAKIGDDQRVAFAKVVLSATPTDTWEMDASQNVLGIPGFGVDSGAACFVDAALGAVLKPLTENEDFSERLADEMDKTYQHTWSWANVSCPELGGSNVIMFSSGYGDGQYCSFIGRDRSGQATSIVTSFGLLNAN